MIYAQLKDEETGIKVRSFFDKHYKTDTYEVFFNTKTGIEVHQGINGNPDPFKTDLPLLLDIGVMGTCQNRCPFCYQGDAEEPNMTLDNFMDIIDQVAHHTNQVALGGRGDPNKHEDFEDLIWYARKNGVVPSYTTSGIDLTDEEIEISKMCGAVAVSDYGTPPTYEAIQRFINAGIKTNIHLIFSRGSYDKCIKILHGQNPWRQKEYSTSPPFFSIEKLNGVVILLFKPQGRGADCQDLIPHPYQIENVASLLFKQKSLFRIGIDSCLANHVFKYGQVPHEQKIAIDTCEASRMSAYITPSMKMMPCSYANPKFAIPITKKKDIAYIWKNSIPFTAFNTRLKKDEYCCPAGF